MKKKISVTICLVVAAALIVASSVSAKGKKRRPAAGRSYKVVLSPMGGEYPSKILKRKNQHPYDIPEDVFFRMLNSFEYRNKRKAMLGWEEKRLQVFSSKLAKRASGALRKAFKKARSSQKVIFTNFTHEGKTICEIFIQKDVINWKFFYLRGRPRTMNMWMLVPGYLQRHYGTGDKLLSAQGIFGGGNYRDHTWIRMPLLRYLSEVKRDRKLVGGLTGKEKEIKGNKLVRLKKLTAMLRRELISREEYLEKVDSLMNNKAGEKLDIEEELEYLKILKDQKIITRDAYLQRKRMLLEDY